MDSVWRGEENFSEFKYLGFVLIESCMGGKEYCWKLQCRLKVVDANRLLENGKGLLYERA